MSKHEVFRKIKPTARKCNVTGFELRSFINYIFYMVESGSCQNGEVLETNVFNNLGD